MPKSKGNSRRRNALKRRKERMRTSMNLSHMLTVSQEQNGSRTKWYDIAAKGPAKDSGVASTFAKYYTPQAYARK